MGTVEVSKCGLDLVNPDLDPLIFLHLGTLATLMSIHLRTQLRDPHSIQNYDNFQ